MSKCTPKTVVAAEGHASLIVHVGDPLLPVDHVRVVADDLAVSVGAGDHVGARSAASG